MAKNGRSLPPDFGGEGSIPPGLLAAAERVRGARSTGRSTKGRPPGTAGRSGAHKRAGTGGQFGKGGRPAPLRLFTLILGLIAAVLVVVIGAGTLYAWLRDPGVFPGASPAETGSTAGTGSASGTAPASGPGMFTDIGRLRIAAGSRSTVILSIVFPYPADDRPFTEELAAKVPLFRQIARDYFGALSQDELDSFDEQKAKDEILQSFNNELRLGRVALLFFNDLLILE